MAFSGLSVICAYAGSSAARHKSQAIIGRVLWTEEPAQNTPTTNGIRATRNQVSKMGIFSGIDQFLL